MSVIDASSIYTAIKEKKVRYVMGSTTIELARFELGNIIWKEHTLLHHITWDEAIQLMELGEKTLKTLLFIDLSGFETDILETAHSSGLNYYDASYLQATKELEVELFTEDKRLAKAAAHLGIPSRSTTTL
ncbi:MAG: type II toxin-antitoxin system VapC family toxin [Candidatus Bathyarchaeota archaeon]|nr:type II toxin-antitoxin system VapC family toxin [Candidatus Bathyarchaeota archaeon]